MLDQLFRFPVQEHPQNLDIQTLASNITDCTNIAWRTTIIKQATQPDPQNRSGSSFFNEAAVQVNCKSSLNLEAGKLQLPLPFVLFVNI